jgi:dGTPase
VQKLLAPLSDERAQGLDARQSDVLKDAPPEQEPDQTGKRSYRTRAERDRDRILYSSALARLAYVTQVTAPESGHTFHNRLSHTFKVAQVARRNTERLKRLAENRYITGASATLLEAVDPESVEASALAHDLGHPPFGHIAEEMLQEAAKDHVRDAFEGNAQSFRLVTRLSVRSKEPGLDLTRRTLDGLLKYPWKHSPNDPKFPKREHKWGYYGDDAEAFAFTRKGWPAETEDALPERCLEAELMDWADDVTYAVHDMDDFFRAGLVPLDRLSSSDGPASPEGKHLAQLLRDAKRAKPEAFPKWEVEDLVKAATDVIGAHGPTAPYQHTTNARAEMRTFASKLITNYLEAFSLADHPASGQVALTIDDEAQLQVEALKMLVVVYVVRRPSLAVVQHGQKRVICDLFNWYYAASEPKGDRRVFPPSARERLEKTDDSAGQRARVVVDLIAGLTETAAIQLHHRLAGGWTASALDATAVIG